jgi:hypothetical protein
MARELLLNSILIIAHSDIFIAQINTSRLQYANDIFVELTYKNVSVNF